ncbi:MAG: hypothetical protein EPN91_10305 [Salinibacterium sp.]|nr:MAG: hypothetical protein EPN91_10305 [Salinibacterium sp.]
MGTGTLAGTGAAGATVTATGYVVNIYVGGVLVSGKVDFRSLKFTESGNQQVGNCRLEIIDMTNSVSVTDKAFVSIADATDQLFKGYVKSRTPRVAAVGRIIEIEADGIEVKLDTSLVISNRRPPSGSTPVESDAARLAYLLGTYGSQGLFNGSFGSTDVSKIQTLQASMPTQKFRKLTLRQAIEQVLGEASQTANYYIDNLGRLHTFDATHPEGDAAPYVIRVGDPGAGEISPEEPDFGYDAQALKNGYWVNAKVAIASHWVPDQTSIDQYGLWAGYVDAPDADTYAKAEAVGQAALKDTAQPLVNGSFKVSSPYDKNGSLRWKVGQMVTIYSTQHGINGGQSRIVGIDWQYLSGAGDREATIRVGGDRLKLRGGSTNLPAGDVG